MGWASRSEEFGDSDSFSARLHKQLTNSLSLSRTKEDTVRKVSIVYSSLFRFFAISCVVLRYAIITTKDLPILVMFTASPSYSTKLGRA